MSVHWHQNDFHRARRRPIAVGRAEIGIVVAGGIALGLAYVGISALRPAATPEAPLVQPDYYAEARKSREILAKQEAGPIPRVEPAKPEIWSERVGRGDVVDVIDGDTFRYAGQTIRIADIDTPETNPPRCTYEAELGERATRRLAGLLAEGPFTLDPIGRDQDKYGRKLRVVTRGGKSIGSQLVAEGLARTWTGRRQPWCA